MSVYHKAAINASKIECQPASQWELQCCKTAEDNNLFKRYRRVFRELVADSEYPEMDLETSEMLAAHIVDIMREGKQL